MWESSGSEEDVWFTYGSGGEWAAKAADRRHSRSKEGSREQSSRELEEQPGTRRAHPGIPKSPARDVHRLTARARKNLYKGIKG